MENPTDKLILILGTLAVRSIAIVFLPLGKSFRYKKYYSRDPFRRLRNLTDSHYQDFLMLLRSCMVSICNPTSASEVDIICIEYQSKHIHLPLVVKLNTPAYAVAP